MSGDRRLLAIDLPKFRALLGSGEEAFCAKVLRTIPQAAARLAVDADLLKEWKRGVTGLVLGDAGEALSNRQPFEETDRTVAGPGLSLAFASLLAAFAQEEPGGPLPPGLALREDLRQRPLFGLDSDGSRVRWGALDRRELEGFASGLDLVSLSGAGAIVSASQK